MGYSEPKPSRWCHHKVKQHQHSTRSCDDGNSSSSGGLYFWTAVRQPAKPPRLSLHWLLFILLIVLEVGFAKPAKPCPVTVWSNHSSCECRPMAQIFCTNLDRIPRFERDGKIYLAIYMENQAIREVSNSDFFNLSVKKLSLNYNNLYRIDVNGFVGLESDLQELQLGECGIRNLPERMIDGMVALKTIHLWGNLIDTVPPSFFYAAPNLETIYLWGNRITTIYDDSFARLWKLKRLDLDRNLITEIPSAAFRHLTRLEVLHLGENKMAAIGPETFKYLTNLKVLNLDRNGIKYVFPNSFEGLDNLVSLDLQRNNIDFIPDGISKDLPSLVTLWLQNNQIAHVWVGIFKGFEHLQTLSLAGNLVTRVPWRLLEDCRKLRYIYIDSNKIKHVNKCIFHKHVKLKTLSMLGNPLKCDCDLSWVVDLHQRGTAVWGTCPSAPGNTTLTSVINRLNYDFQDCIIQESMCKP